MICQDGLNRLNLAARPNSQLGHGRCSRGCRLGLTTPRLGDVWISGTLRSRSRWHFRHGCEVTTYGGFHKSSIFTGFSIINRPFGDTSIYGTPHMHHLFEELLPSSSVYLNGILLTDVSIVLFCDSVSFCFSGPR